MTATDADALLATILANPADDAPRLVYADWLDEHGEGERAEFVRVQCDKNYTPDWAKDKPRVRKGRGFEMTREQRLHRYLLPIPVSLVGWDNGWVCYTTGQSKIVQRFDVQFCRGFVHTIRAPLAAIIGGVCGRCGGQRIVDVPRPANVRAGGRMIVCEDCPDCRGTGRTPGLRGLVRREPVEAVLVTDREPIRLSVGGYEFYVTDRPGVPDAISWDLAEANGRGLCKTFPTPAAAAAALGRAVLAHLRADW